MQPDADPISQAIGWLDSEQYGGSPAQWLVAIAVALLVFVVLRIVKHVLTTRLKGVVERTANVVDDLLLDLVRRTGTPFLAAFALYVGSLFLRLPAAHGSVVHKVFVIVLFLQVGAWANHVVTFSVDAYLRDKTKQELGTRVAVVSLFNFFARLVVWSVVALLVLENLGIDVTALIAGLGVGGIAIGLALQSVLRDTFASLSIILDKPFEVGDFVIIDDFAGNIEEIGLKTTRLRSITGEQLVFGNDDLLSCRIRNFKRMEERRSLFRFAVAYETPTATLREISGMMREIVESVDHTRFDRAHFKQYGEHGLEFEVVYYLTVPDYNVMRDVQERVNLELHHRFQERGIRFAYPTRRLLVEKEESGAAAVP